MRQQVESDGTSIYCMATFLAFPDIQNVAHVFSVLAANFPHTEHEIPSLRYIALKISFFICFHWP